jgi:protein-L-isoaspartate O-methyltransferase
MGFDSYARRLWAGRADAYEHGFARLTVHAVGALLDAAGAGTGTRVLDVGTGPGVVAGAAAARGARVTAVDAEPSMAEAAARNVPGLDVRVGRVRQPGRPVRDRRRRGRPARQCRARQRDLPLGRLASAAGE